MHEILHSLQPVIRSSQHVQINREGIQNFANSLTEADLQFSDVSLESLEALKSQEDNVAFIIIYASIVASTWGEPKWGLTISGKKLGGSASILFALRKSLANGYPLLSPTYLSEMPREDLKKILTSSNKIPLFNERLVILHKLGSEIIQKFDASFWNILEKGKFSAPSIVQVLTQDFPTLFCDQASYRGHIIQFHKLAQLAASMLIELHEQGMLNPAISGEAELTALADYKVPQALHKAGLLTYSSELTNKLLSKTELLYGSGEEVEIRAFTIYAIDEVVKRVNVRLPQATAVRVDRALWHRSQVTAINDLPHHRTRTTWY